MNLPKLCFLLACRSRAIDLLLINQSLSQQSPILKSSFDPLMFSLVQELKNFAQLNQGKNQAPRPKDELNSIF
jgi:hypothetical protein